MRYFPVFLATILLVVIGCAGNESPRPREYICSSPREVVPTPCPSANSAEKSSKPTSGFQDPAVRWRGNESEFPAKRDKQVDDKKPASPDGTVGTSASRSYPIERPSEPVVPAKPKSAYDGLRVLVEFNDATLCRQYVRNDPWDAVTAEVDSIITKRLMERGALRIISQDDKHRPSYDILLAVCLSESNGGYEHWVGSGGIPRYIAQVILKETRDGRTVAKIGTGSEYFVGQEFNGGIYRYEAFRRAAKTAISELLRRQAR